MSQKKPLPALQGARRRQRKRNIAHQYEPEIFLEALEEHFQHETVSEIRKSLDTDADLEFRRYADHFFDRLISGGMGLCIGRPDLSIEPEKTSLLGCSDEDIPKWITLCEMLMRRRPFLKIGLADAIAHTMIGLDMMKSHLTRIVTICAHLTAAELLSPDIPSSDFFLLHLAKATHLIQKGIAGEFLIHFSKVFASLSGEDAAWELLDHSEIAERIDDFFPGDVATLLKESGAPWLADRRLLHLSRNMQIKHRAQCIEWVLEHDVKESDSTAPPADIAELLRQLHAAQEECKISDKGILALTWDIVASTISYGVRNTYAHDAVRAIKRWGPVLASLVGEDMEVQAVLLTIVQRTCYEEPRLLEAFGQIVPQLYGVDALEAEVIEAWFKHAGGSGIIVFKKQLESFVQWLEEQSEEESYSEESD
eukprot:gnl/Dysnectes_brevis/954_a1063_3322.p1 GENE.gnl/Dysnectes_brevis/954_a1063_3322~~gnl/Dysnectes_brevis/954_a1063_3322.p1  ORF type:complete len:423 (+),score=136.34 gnl/Dysnectes_brevis/954_a1063_3322:37-1305(+)